MNKNILKYPNLFIDYFKHSLLAYTNDLKFPEGSALLGTFVGMCGRLMRIKINPETD